MVVPKIRCQSLIGDFATNNDLEIENRIAQTNGPVIFSLGRLVIIIWCQTSTTSPSSSWGLVCEIIFDSIIKVSS